WILVLLTLATEAYSQHKLFIAKDIITQKYSFENTNDLKGWHPVKGSLSISNKHFKDGKKSLAWNWLKGDTLEIANLKGLKEAASIYPGGQPEIFEPAFYPKGRY